MNFEKIKRNLEQVYDELAEFWGKDGSLHDWGGEDLKKFAQMVKANGQKNVLDLGCGSGVQVKMLLAEGLDVLGLDISRNMINEAKRRAPAAKFIIGDIANLTFSKNSFGGVYARASLLHIPKAKIRHVLKNIFGILKPGGIFYLAVKEGEGERELEDDRYGRKVNRFFAFFEKEELEELVRESGFDVMSLERFKKEESSTAWLVIFAKKP